MSISDEEIKRKAKTYDNAMSSMAESVWMPIGFIEGAKWMRDKMSGDRALLEEAVKIITFTCDVQECANCIYVKFNPNHKPCPENDFLTRAKEVLR